MLMDCDHIMQQKNGSGPMGHGYLYVEADPDCIIYPLIIHSTEEYKLVMFGTHLFTN